MATKIIAYVPFLLACKWKIPYDRNCGSATEVENSAFSSLLAHNKQSILLLSSSNDEAIYS